MTKEIVHELPTHSNFIDLTGDKYGQLLVLSYAGKKNKSHTWNCRCDCGGHSVVHSYSLRSGNTRSCGCLKSAPTPQKATRYKDMIGLRFGRLKVVSFFERKGTSYFWKCICDCGAEKNVRSDSLKRGKTTSCGCRSAEVATHHEYVGGKPATKHELFSIWEHMNRRCYAKNNGNYKNYGGRGIRVCERWRNSFKKFVEDMGPRDDRSLTLERLNNDGNYEPQNCVWASIEEQQRNKRTVRLNESVVLDIRRRYDSGETVKSIHENNNIDCSFGCIEDVAYRRTWKGVEYDDTPR